MRKFLFLLLFASFGLYAFAGTERHAVAVAAFGNSYWTDGPFLRYVVTQPLPGGAKGTAVMVNGSGDDAGYRGFFRCVTQDEICGKALPLK